MIYDKDMTCPDCGQELVEVSVTGFDKSHRCSNCGGVWLEVWVANRVAEGQMKDLPEAKADVEKFTGKSNKCPVDGAPLFGYTGEDMPPEAAALKCSHCGQWWFPDDSLFKFRKAYEAKNNYMKLWHKKSQLTMMVMPILMVLLLAVTMGIVVTNIGRSQMVGTQASAGSVQFSADYNGGGQETIRFKPDKPVGMVLFKRVQDEVWGPADVEINPGGWYTVRLTNMDETSVYQMQIAGKKYYFKAK
jgi:Zn-finger nucleic acid-binding protein